jgi:hypothetical protein
MRPAAALARFLLLEHASRRDYAISGSGLEDDLAPLKLRSRSGRRCADAYAISASNL